LTATACFAIGLGLVNGEEDGPSDLDPEEVVGLTGEDGHLGLTGEDGPAALTDLDPVMEEDVKGLVDWEEDGLEDGPEGLVDPTGVVVVGSD